MKLRRWEVVAFASVLLIVAMTGCRKSGPQSSNDSKSGGTDSVETKDQPSQRYVSFFMLKTKFGQDQFVSPPDLNKGIESIDEGYREYTELPPPVKEYKQLHDQMPESVKEAMARHNLRNYSVHVSRNRHGEYFAVRYYEYVGENHIADTIQLSQDLDFNKWTSDCDRCQIMLLEGTHGWWNSMEEIYFEPLSGKSTQSDQVDQPDVSEETPSTTNDDDETS